MYKLDEYSSIPPLHFETKSMFASFPYCHPVLNEESEVSKWRCLACTHLVPHCDLYYSHWLLQMFLLQSSQEQGVVAQGGWHSHPFECRGVPVDSVRPGRRVLSSTEL